MKTIENRFVVLGAATLTLASLGILYCWSVFIPALESEFGASRSEVSFVFSITMVMWSFGMLAAGWVSKRLPLKACFVLGLCFIVAGFISSALVSGVAPLYFTYGVLCGFGIGLSYNLWMSHILGLFPDRIGTASGILLLGFGLGSMILSVAASALVASTFGWRGTFMAAAALIAVLTLAALPFVHQAPTSHTFHEEGTPSRKPSGKTSPGLPTPAHATLPALDAGPSQAAASRTILKQSSFWAFTIWKVFVMGSAAAVIAQSSVLIADTGASALFAAAAVGAINLGNAFGRLIAGFFFDRLGQSKMMIMLPATGLIAGIGLVSAYAFDNAPFLVVFLLVEGLVYGAYANLNTSFIRNTYGQQKLSTNLGISSFTLMPFNLVFPVIAAATFDLTGNYFYFLLALPAIAAISLLAGTATNKATK